MKNHFWRRTAKRWLISLLMIAAVGGGSSHGAPQKSHYVAPTDQRDQAARIASAFNSLAESVPASTFRIDGLAESLDYDFKAAINFVTGSVAFDPYVGVLRGPEGTLRALAGSAWDQAGLLVSLISSMAGEAQIVRGNLSLSDSRRLLEVAFKPRAGFVEPLTIDDALLGLSDVLPSEWLGEYRKNLARSDKSTRLSALSALALDVSSQLQQALTAAGRSVPDQSPADALVAEISRSYVWVRYRETPNQPWTEVHPSFGGEAAPNVVSSGIVAKSVPKEWIHSLRFELLLERTAKGITTTEALMEPYHGTVASFSTHHTRLDIQPNRLPKTVGDSPEFFLISINGEPASGGKAFTLQGITAPAADALIGPSIFLTLSSKMGGALSALSAENSQDLPRLTGLILRVTHMAPGGLENTEDRRLVDFREEVPEFSWADITQSIVFGILTGPTNGAAEIRGTLVAGAQSIRTAPYLAALATKKISPDEALTHPALNRPQADIVWSDLVRIQNAFQRPTRIDELVVRSSPMVINRRSSIKAVLQGHSKVVVDVMHHDVVALRRNSSDQIVEAPTLRMAQGIWDTIVEHYLVRWNPTFDWMKATPKAVISDRPDLNQQTRSLTRIRAERMYSDFKKAGTVITLADTRHWWRLNPVSGQVLGMTDDGGGAETTEYATKVISALGNTVTLAATIYGTSQCKGSGGSLSCCILVNLTATYLLSGIPIIGPYSIVAKELAGSAKELFYATLIFFVLGLISDGTSAFALDTGQLCR